MPNAILKMRKAVPARGGPTMGDIIDRNEKEPLATVTFYKDQYLVSWRTYEPLSTYVGVFLRTRIPLTEVIHSMPEDKPRLSRKPDLRRIPAEAAILSLEGKDWASTYETGVNDSRWITYRTYFSSNNELLALLYGETGERSVDLADLLNRALKG